LGTWSSGRDVDVTGQAASCPLIQPIPSPSAGATANYLKEPLMAARDVTRGSVRADGNGSSVGRVARRLATETKQAFKTTEFWAMLGLVLAILVSAAVINGGDNGTDEFIARQAWLYVSILGAGYFISRGLAKSGSSEPYTADDSDR
jgi:hypothetical protein